MAKTTSHVSITSVLGVSCEESLVIAGFFWHSFCCRAFCRPTSSGAELQIKSDTILRLFERDTATTDDATVLPGYEYLQVDAGHLQDYGLSFHLYGWGRNDFADNDYYENQTAGELLYGYLEYRQEANRFNAKLGRFQVFEGVANDAIDGLRLSSDLGDYFALSLYGGQPVGARFGTRAQRRQHLRRPAGPPPRHALRGRRLVQIDRQ